ncbi:transglutaminase domain protein [Paenibacillus curdlanolyticus YK9]|uniref:Transglutaminase domain protein n=1 Tax=Paenibacillus curdlanolyticus YK9 TaxID=717606 RepID=E0IBI7_9BACL|nr:transglutaminase family protein [Paenibacillus curdlanolyticus]EFM10067.1 transglutaminase domain protein [Paenibacillus curdlanolyticus YK9]
MKLYISHLTQYSYGDPVTDSVNEIRLTPSTNERQSCYNHSISIEPNASLFTYEDSFGNRVHSFSVNAPHTKLMIKTNMTVVTTESFSKEESAYKQQLKPSDAWAKLHSDESVDRFIEFLLPTEYTEVTPEIFSFMENVPVVGTVHEAEASEGGVTVSVTPAIGVYDWLAALSKHIRSAFIYDPLATDVRTKAFEMIAKRRGVCQDFAHLMVAVCRARGVPARYVSGYHFVGDLQGGSAEFEQASHAWVEAYVPKLGWCGFDPTNESPIGERYVKLGHGRDYKDIVPVKGIYHGTGKQSLQVTVDVRKVEE